MTTSNDTFAPVSTGPTTSLPGSIEIDVVLPELTTPQERYDNGYKRGYLAGYAEGARQAQAEGAADMASQKAMDAACQARAGALLGQLGTATQQYLERFGPQELALTDELVRAAFELAEAVVACELRARPDRAFEVARQVLAGLPAGPATVRVNPVDLATLGAAPDDLGNAAQNVVIVADASISAGGCVVTSGATSIDARVSEALARARDAFCGEPL